MVVVCLNARILPNRKAVSVGEEKAATEKGSRKTRNKVQVPYLLLFFFLRMKGVRCSSSSSAGRCYVSLFVKFPLVQRRERERESEQEPSSSSYARMEKERDALLIFFALLSIKLPSSSQSLSKKERERDASKKMMKRPPQSESPVFVRTQEESKKLERERGSAPVN